MTDQTQPVAKKKIAQLPNGHEIHFPEHTADSEMDDTVKRHLGVAPSSGTKKLLESFTKVLTEHAAAEENAPDKSGNSPYDRDAHANYRATKLDINKQGHLMAQQNNQELIAAIVPLLKALAVNGPNIVKAINTLTQTIQAIGSAHIEIAGGDREIVPDEKTGKPKKLRINRRK